MLFIVPFRASNNIYNKNMNENIFLFFMMLVTILVTNTDHAT